MTLHASLEQVGAGGAPTGRLRETIRDEETVRELRAMIAADERSAFASRSAQAKTRWRLTVALTTAALVLIAVLVGQRVLRQQCIECHEEANSEDPEEVKFVEEYVKKEREVPWLVYSRPSMLVKTSTWSRTTSRRCRPPAGTDTRPG